MAKSLNLCQFIGNIGQDPEISTMPNGNTVAKISLACSDDYKDKNTGQKVEQTNWIRVVAFGRLAEIIGEYCRKGSKIYISGKQVTRKWQAQDGTDRYSTEIVASEMQMLDGAQGGGQSQQPAQGQAPRQAPAQQQAAPNYGDFTDDIPFMRLGKEHSF